MAFKVEQTLFDWDVELPVLQDDGSYKDEVVKCVRVMNNKDYSTWMDLIDNLVPKKKNIKGVDISSLEIQKPSVSIEKIISQVDWLYEKGPEWWKSKIKPDVIIKVRDHLFEYTKDMAEKKSS